MWSSSPCQLEQRVYEWRRKRVDAGGFPESSSAGIAHDLKIPHRTCQGVFSRLEGTGKLDALGFGCIAIVELVERGTMKMRIRRIDRPYLPKRDLYIYFAELFRPLNFTTRAQINELERL